MTPARSLTRSLGFLSDEERVPERGAAALARVRAVLRTRGENVTGLFEAANLLALVMFHARRVQDAVEVSRRSIERGQRLAAEPGRESLLFHTLQPQINLLRIEGFAGDPDVALAGLSGLDDLASGRRARVGDLKFDEDAIAAADAAGLPLRRLAAAVRTVDTCKILWRRGRTDELLEFAATDGTGRVPASAGPTHGREAPWLVRPLEVPTRTPPTTPLGFIRLLHIADAAVAAGEWALAGRTVSELAEARTVLTRFRFLSPLTPARCLASLAESALRLGAEEVALEVGAEAAAIADHEGDRLLGHQLAALLDGGEPADPPPDLDSVSPDDLQHTVTELFFRLAEKGSPR
jgi:hypothetical protein